MHFTRPRARRVLVGVVMLAVAGGATACGAAPTPVRQPPTTRPATARPVPAGGVTLAQLGFAHGPRDFSLPEGVRVVQRVDQSNVVTLVMDRPSGPELARWLRERAREEGVAIRADAGDALVYDVGVAPGAGGWSVAFTGGEPSGLTLRKQA